MVSWYSFLCDFFLCFCAKGIIVGLDNLDEIIQVIRKASSNAMASTDLMKSKLNTSFCNVFKHVMASGFILLKHKA